MDRNRVETVPDDGKRAVKSYVLRASRMADSLKQALVEYSHEFSVAFSGKPLDFSTLFGNDHPTVVEIGFGMGEATLEIARRHPERNHLGIEVFLNGFAKVLHEIGRDRMQNLRIIRFDAVEVLQTMIRDNSVAAFHIFFPDPWPKKKHHKRRLIQEPFVSLLAEKLVDGGYVYCVTDWEPYAEQMVQVFGQSTEFANPSHGYATDISWRPSTSFERKGLSKEHPIREIWVERTARP